MAYSALPLEDPQIPRVSVILATRCPVLHEALAVWHPRFQSSWPHCLPPAWPRLQELQEAQRFCPPGACEGLWGCPGCICFALPIVPPVASARDPRTRGAALPISWTKHKGMPCLARACLTEGFFLPHEASIPEYKTLGNVSPGGCPLECLASVLEKEVGVHGRGARVGARQC